MRSWLVIPAGGAAAAGLAVALRAPGFEVAVVALAAAGVAGTIRTISGAGPAAIAAAAIGALAAAASLLEHGAIGFAGAAVAAACWSFAELARDESGARALVAAGIAAVLEPSFAVILPIASLRVPWRRWAFVAVALALVGVVAGAAVARQGVLAELGARWFGGRAALPPLAFAEQLGEAVGPITAVAALGGFAAALMARRATLAELAIAASTLAVVAIDVRAGGVAPVTLALAALWAGLAIAGLGGLVRLRAGQAIVAAVAGGLLIAPPAWSVIAHGPRIAILR